MPGCHTHFILTTADQLDMVMRYRNQQIAGNNAIMHDTFSVCENRMFNGIQHFENRVWFKCQDVRHFSTVHWKSWAANDRF